MFEFNKEYEVLTPTDFQNFKGIEYKGKKETYKVICDNADYFIGTKEHKMIGELDKELKISDMKIGDKIKTTNGYQKIEQIEFFDNSDVYDLIDVDNGHQFVVNSVFISKNCDELSFVPSTIAQEYWSAISPVLSTGGSCILTSTPNTDEDLFATIWKAANQTETDDGEILEEGVGVNGFHPVKFIWSDHPDRNERWALTERRKIGDAKFLQEHECIEENSKIKIKLNNKISEVTIGELYLLENKKDAKILTDTGFEDFDDVLYKGEQEIFRIMLDDEMYIDTTVDHEIFTNYGQVSLMNLTKEDKVITKNGIKNIKDVIPLKQTSKVYDILNSGKYHRFYANDILVSNCEFVSSDDTLIDSLFLSNMVSKDVYFWIDDIKWYEEPKANHIYGVSWDPSKGTGNDNAAIQVFDMSTLTQVAEWCNPNKPCDKQVEVLLKILYFLYQELYQNPDQKDEPEIIWSVENNGLGEAAIMAIKYTGEDNFPGYFISERIGTKGFNTNNKKKVSACTILKRLIESGKMTINSKKLISEFKTFVESGPGYEAKNGYHDDLVMSTVLIVRMLQKILNWDESFEKMLSTDIDIGDLIIVPKLNS